MNKLSLIWKTKDLRSKILIVLGLLLLTRILAHVPIPGIDVGALKSALEQNQFLGLLDIFSGGGLSNFSIAMLGVGPYITASIIMQLLAILIPKLGELQKEGEQGRAKVNQYTRYLAVPLAILQGFGTITIFTRSGASGGANVLGQLTSAEWFIITLSITAGTM